MSSFVSSLLSSSKNYFLPFLSFVVVSTTTTTTTSNNYTTTTSSSSEEEDPMNASSGLVGRHVELEIVIAVAAAVMVPWLLLVLFRQQQQQQQETQQEKKKKEEKDDITKKKKKESQLWLIHGVWYDLSEFVSRHPGGREAILLGRGRDCTALVESYHPFTQKAVRAVLDKYAASTTRNEQQQQQTSAATAVAAASECNGSSSGSGDWFYDILVQRVEATLRSKGIDPIQDRTASSKRVAYYGIMTVAVGISAYFYGQNKGRHVISSLVWSVSLAVFGWLWGSLGHDAGHFAASRNAVVNEWGVWAMMLLCNPIQWQHQHTYAHHSYTNEFDRDPDLHHFQQVLLRVHPRFPKLALFLNQIQKYTILVLLAYCFVVFGTCIAIPFEILFLKGGSLHGVVQIIDSKRFGRVGAFLVHWIAYIGFIVILPFYRSSSRMLAAATVLVHLTTSGLLFALFSQINHLNQPSIQHAHNNTPTTPNKPNNNKKSWAIDQIETSNNFAVDSVAWYIWSNGLNLQIEHHLFPGLNHEHLHHIVPIVQQTCQEYGVNYKAFQGWHDIFKATLHWLQVLAADSDQQQQQQQQQQFNNNNNTTANNNNINKIHQEDVTAGISPSSSTSSLPSAGDDVVVAVATTATTTALKSE